jgi:hypothetical protein
VIQPYTLWFLNLFLLLWLAKKIIDIMDILQSIQDLTIGSPGFCCYIGALILHIFSMYDKNFHGTEEFLTGILPNKSKAFYKRVDFICLPIIGTIIAIVLMSPKGPVAGMFSGLSWSGTLVAFLKRGTHPNPQINGV